MGCILIMSSKKVNNMETKNKSSQSRKNRRRSTRNANTTNGEPDDPKERCGKRPRDINAKENADNTEEGPDSDVYKEIIDLLPASDLNCSPAEVPAPPGTRVNLHGVILHETQGGLIVLNVRWRNKVYSGALIDAEKNKWATDRISSSDGPPAAEENKQFQAPPPIKKLRIPTNSANTTQAEDSDSGNNKKKGAISPTTTTPTKTTPKTPRGNGKKRATQESPPAPAEETTPAKKSKGRLLYNGEHLYECAEPNCEKKYKNKNGLSYHIRTMHPTKTESADESGKENKSDNSRDESDSGDDNFVIDEKADEESKDGDSEDKNANIEEQNGSQSDGEGDEEKREELTENEKEIDRLKLEAEKSLAVLSNMRQKAEVDDIKQEEMECDGDEATPVDNSTEKMDNSTEKMLTVKKEECDDEDTGERTNDDNEGETVEPLVDVESDSLPGYQWKNENKDGQPPVTSEPWKSENKDAQAPVTSEPSTKEGQSTTIPTIKVDPSPSDENTGSDEKNDHPKGTSRTIIHEDHVNSLNELFAPTQTYHQYSPTLTNLNPQKINESLTDALSKQPTVSTMSTVTTCSQPKIENTSEPVKETLAAKPSVEISRSEPPVTATTLESRLPLDLLKGGDYMRAPMDYVACSDDERSISPENALTECHKTYPQDERDVKTSKPNLLSIALNTSSMYMNPLLQTMLEQSILGQAHTLLGQTQRTFEKSLLFKELGNKVSNAAMSMNTFQNKVPSSMPNIPNKIGLQDMPLPSNIDPKSHTSSLINTSSSSSDSNKPNLPFDPSREFAKPSLLEQRLLAQPAKSTESSGTVSTTIGNNAFLPHNSSFDQLPQNREHPLKQPSLLEQRLLADTVKSDAMATSNVPSNNNKMFLQQPGSNTGPPIPRPGSKPEESNKTIESNEKLPNTSSFTVNRDITSNEKPKTPATSLRINPPTSLEERVQIGTHTWFPEVVNDANPSLATPDYYNSPPVVSSSFRIPVPKTYPSYSIQSSVNTSMSDPKNPKNIAKRAMQPVPIAPAPSPSLQPSRNEFSAPPLDYVSPNGDKEQSQMGRFTLTSDNRLIPSPAENRGRPRKVRVEKTKQIPIGTAQDIAKVRGPAETSIPRKPSSSSPVVRTSVIQGSIHPGLEGSPKPTDRGPDGHMMFPQHRDMRNYDIPPDERERFNHEKDLKPPMEMRNNEKYQVGSPPGMYFSPTVGRTLLSPPLPRSASHSPRSVDMLTRPVDVLTRPGAPIPRSSPVGHHDGFSKAQFQMALERMSEYNPGNNPGPDHARNVLEHAWRKPELLRPVSESPHDNRKHPLSPLTEKLHVIQAYARAHEIERDRMTEYLNSGRYPPPPGVRNDFAQGRGDNSRSMFEHRSPVEENEQARLIRDRERYMQQSRANVYRGSPPSHAAPQPGHHSANLVLGTADGSIIGPLSSYENRPAEHKR